MAIDLAMTGTHQLLECDAFVAFTHELPLYSGRFEIRRRREGLSNERVSWSATFSCRSRWPTKRGVDADERRRCTPPEEGRLDVQIGLGQARWLVDVIRADVQAQSMVSEPDAGDEPRRRVSQEERAIEFVLRGAPLSSPNERPGQLMQRARLLSCRTLYSILGPDVRHLLDAFLWFSDPDWTPERPDAVVWGLGRGTVCYVESSNDERRPPRERTYSNEHRRPADAPEAVRAWAAHVRGLRVSPPMNLMHLSPFTE